MTMRVPGFILGIIPPSLDVVSQSLCRAERDATFAQHMAILQIAGMIVGLIGVVVVHHFFSQNKDGKGN